MPATVKDRPRIAIEDHQRQVVGRLRRLGPVWVHRGTLIRLGILALAVYAAVKAVDKWGRHYTFFDMNIYHGAMVWWTHGGNLYDFVAPNTTLGFTYPPFAALVMAPMAVLPALAAGWVNTVISLAAFTVLLAWLLVPIADRYGWRRWFVVALAVPLAGATEPIRETLGFGQVNILLALLIYADFVALRNRAKLAATPSRLAVTVGAARTTGPTKTASPTETGGTVTGDAADDTEGAEPIGTVAAALRRLWNSGALAGLGVGLATAIKLTPGVFIAYFVVTKQWRAAIVSAATTAVVTLLTFAVAGKAATQYFTSVVFDTSRVGAVDATANQSLAGVLARLYDSTTTPTLMWLAFAALLFAVGMIRGSGAHSDGDELAAFTIVGLTGNAICPISWSHHLVFLIPALIVLGDSALRRHQAARGLSTRDMWSWGPGGMPAMAGLTRAAAAIGVYVLFVVSPIWKYEHKFPAVSHYADGLHGAFWENSLALAVIALVVLLPWRPGADPAFYPEPALARRATLRNR
ncbi:glycosyltransferase 87 family protein [Rugosimonospora africana]|nr:glycosyltransferase 87 family protein [Rugosimonospora africana]